MYSHAFISLLKTGVFPHGFYKSAFVRIRAAMIMMAQVKWTSPDNVLPYVLKLLHDEKSSAVRQCLKLLSTFLKAAPRYSDTVMSEVKTWIFRRTWTQ